MPAEHELLTDAYRAFNARDIDAVLTLMHADVDWPNGMEGGYVHGHQEVCDYWTRQWTMIDPHVEPQHFSTADDGRIVVDVHQVIRDTAGNLIADQVVQHIYLIQDDLVKHMEIRKP